jgi:hypothetical protein
MKPLNFDNSPCSPTSSNCVIWSGPDLPCISLCQGDSITDVVEKLATELCTILDTLNINSYDLDCFNLVNCAPQTFTDLINFLIVKVCELENIPVTSCSTGSSGCPTDCIVSVAPCFVVNGQTTMNLTDYVVAIGEKICAIIDVNNLQDIAITNLDDRVTILENTPPPVYTTPTMVMGCTIDILNSGTTQGIDTVIRTFINDIWCSYVTATGTAGDLVAAVASQCIENTDMSKTYPAQTMSAAYPTTWQTTPTTVADTIENIWVAICDLRNALNGLNVVDTNTIDLTFNTATNELQADIQDTGWVDLLGFDYYTSSMVSSKPQCRRIGSVIYFKGTIIIPLSSTPDNTTLVNLSSSTVYNSQTVPYTYAGTGGVALDLNGAIRFNNNTNIIPTSVWAGSFDFARAFGTVIATRQVDLNGSYGACLTAALSLSMSTSGVLTVATIKDQELSITRPNGLRGLSPLRYITSNIRSGNFVPNYINAGSEVHNLSNVGLNYLSAYTGFTDESALVVSSITWPFSCDAAEEEQIGGFAFRIDNLTMFVAP